MYARSEEAGYTPQTLQSLGWFFSSPGGCSERLFLYLAEVDTAQPSTGLGRLRSHQLIRPDAGAAVGFSGASDDLIAQFAHQRPSVSHASSK